MNRVRDVYSIISNKKGKHKVQQGNDFVTYDIAMYELLGFRNDVSRNYNIEKAYEK